MGSARLKVDFLLPSAQSDWAGQFLSDDFPEGLFQGHSPSLAPIARVHISGWCSDRKLSAQKKLIDRLVGLGATRIRLLRQIPPDWARLYQARFPVQHLGRFIIIPQWKQTSVKVSARQIPIILNPGQAFGTGLHESTRLMLQGLAALGPTLKGAQLLDVGSGSGILGIAAWRLGAGRISNVEVEAAACVEARANAVLNGVPKAKFPVTAGAFPGARLRGQRFDGVLANLVTPVLETLMPQLRAMLKPGAFLFASGIHTPAEALRVRKAMRAAGLRPGANASLRRWFRVEARRP